MQFAKDSFYIALRDRLAALNPARTIVVQGRMRPAVLVDENEPADGSPPLPGAYHLIWGAPGFAKGAEGARRPLMKLDCHIVYAVVAAQPGAVDRGRVLATFDAELLRLLTPPRTPKRDHTATPAGDLGTSVFWGLPEFADADSEHGQLRRKARLTIFYFTEVDQA